MKSEMPTDFQMVMESVKFFCWIFGSIATLAVTLLGIYLRMYVRDALHSHSETIAAMVASKYVRRDMHDQQILNLERRIEEMA